MLSRSKKYLLPGPGDESRTMLAFELQLKINSVDDLEVICFNYLSNPITVQYQMFHGNSFRSVDFAMIPSQDQQKAKKALSGTAMKDAISSMFQGLAFISEHRPGGDKNYNLTEENIKSIESNDDEDIMTFGPDFK